MLAQSEGTFTSDIERISKNMSIPEVIQTKENLSNIDYSNDKDSTTKYIHISALQKFLNYHLRRSLCRAAHSTTIYIYIYIVVLCVSSYYLEIL